MAARRRAIQGNSVAAAGQAVDTQPTTATTVERLAAALKTNPDGTEAGVVLAPFVLAGSSRLNGLDLQLSALEDDVVRAGIAYAWTRAPNLSEVWEQPELCPPPTDEDLDVLLVPAHAFYVQACLDVLADPAALGKASDDRQVQAAREACGLPPSTGLAPVKPFHALGEAIEQVAVGVSQVAATTDLRSLAQTRAVALGPQAKTFEAWEPVLSCRDAAAVEARFEQLYWSHARSRTAVSATVDRFPQKFGFSPDGSALSHGQVAAWSVALAFSRVKSGVEWGFGAGIGQSRLAFTDELAGTLTPSFSAAKAFSLLSSKPLRGKEGRYNVDKDGQPPHLVLGISAAGEFSLDPLPIQTTRWNSVKLQVYLDFFVTDKLSFRLGIPLEGAIAERKEKLRDLTATPPVLETLPGQRSLQWKVPASIVTVLKL